MAATQVPGGVAANKNDGTGTPVLLLGDPFLDRRITLLGDFFPVVVRDRLVALERRPCCAPGQLSRCRVCSES